ncbi:GAF domain-containing sensor histidine kinase [Patescibacteria group bacterium]|nr:GAF domain-containing sensor histidine kinase [Patescibacteria group bacterium]
MNALLDYRFIIIMLFGLVDLALVLIILVQRPILKLVPSPLLIFTVAIGCRLISDAFLQGAMTLSQKAFWLGIDNITGTAAMTSLLYFTILFPRFNLRRLSVFEKSGLWILWLIATAITFIPGATVSLARVNSGQPVSLSPWIHLLNIYDAVLVIAILIVFYRRYRVAKGRTREQIKYIFFGLFFTGVSIFLFNLFLPALGILQLNWLSPLVVNIIAYTILYTLLTRNLLDIRVLIRQSVIYTGLLIFALLIYNVELLIFNAIPALARSDFTSLIASFLGALIIGVSFEPLRLWLEQITNSYFFPRELERQALIQQLSQQLNTVVILNESMDMILQSVVRILGLKRAAIYVFQTGDSGKFATKSIKQIGYSSPHQLYVPEKDLMIEYFRKHTPILFIDNLSRQVELREHTVDTSADIRELAINQATLKRLEALQVEIAIPLHVNQQLIGLIFLSEKRSGEPYHPQDLELLKSVESQVASSIEKAELYEGDQMKSEFVSVASHELLTPLSAIEGFLSLILDEKRGKVDEQVLGYLQKVYTSAKRLSVLIKDVLSVSSIESGRLKIEPQSLDINKMIHDALDQLKFVAQDKHLTLTYQEPADPLPPVYADPDRTMQVLVNLMSNAIKYTPEGSVSIKTHLNRAGGQVQVDITDTGIGMAKEAQSHLFEKFYRVDSPQTTGIIGTGLGLYITKSIIERMGGAIFLKSKIGTGTTFSFTLPVFTVQSPSVVPPFQPALSNR